MFSQVSSWVLPGLIPNYVNLNRSNCKLEVKVDRFFVKCGKIMGLLRDETQCSSLVLDDTYCDLLVVNETQRDSLVVDETQND